MDWDVVLNATRIFGKSLLMAFGAFSILFHLAMYLKFRATRRKQMAFWENSKWSPDNLEDEAMWVGSEPYELEMRSHLMSARSIAKELCQCPACKLQRITEREEKVSVTWQRPT